MASPRLGICSRLYPSPFSDALNFCAESGLNEQGLFSAGIFFTVAMAIAMMRLGRGIGGYRWAASWLCVYASGAFSALAESWPILTPMVPLAGTLFALMLWSGTRRYVGLAIPRAALPIFAAVVAVRVLVQAATNEAVSQALGFAAILAATVASSVLLVRLARSPQGRTVDWILALSYPGLGLSQLLYANWKLQGAAPDGMFLMLVAGIYIGGLQTVALLGRAITIEERRRAELSVLLDSLPIGVLLTDEAGKILAVNGSLEKFTTEVSGASWVGENLSSFESSLRQQASRDRSEDWQEVLSLSNPEGVHELALFDGRKVEVAGHPVRSAGRVVGRLALLRDVTEERELRERAERTGRLATLERLAGGVAHEFNNQLTTILGNVDLLRSEHPKELAGSERFRDMEEAALYCASMVQDLLDFAQQAPAAFASVDVRPFLVGQREKWAAEFDDTVVLELEVAPDAGVIFAEPAQLEQALASVVANAREAAGPAGRIQVSAKRLTTEYGSHLEFCVTDNGPGIDGESRRYVFDPFFTTKPESGTGLSLAIVHTIVTSYGGQIDLEPVPEGGTRVVIRWPTGE